MGSIAVTSAAAVPGGRVACAPVRRTVSLAAGAFVLAATIMAVAAPRAWAAGTHWYAFVGGTAVAASGYCTAPGPATSQQCGLTEVLANAQNGDTVYLGTPASTGSYTGNWTVNASLTIGPAPGVPIAALDGNGGSSATPCATASCNGPVLAVVAGVNLNIDDLVIQSANDLTGSDGGGLKNVGGTVTVTNSTLSNDSAGSQGGAIYNTANGTLTVSDSTFTGNQADYGGAIANGLGGTVTVMGSTFSGNHAVFNGEGGAIDNADGQFGVGSGQLTVMGSTFSGNSARFGGAIDNAYQLQAGIGQVDISGSTFSGNTASIDGGAIDTADNLNDGSATVTVTDSTFAGNSATNHGGAIDNADGYDGSGTNAGITTVVASTFTGDAASVGREIDNDPNPNLVSVAADVLAGSCAPGVTDGGYNVASDTSCVGGVGTDVNVGPGLSADLGPLAYNGGPTQTVAPLPTAANPVVGIIPPGTPSVTLNGSTFALCPTTDQRGAPSNPAKGCDPGAVQTPLLTVRAPSEAITYGSPVPHPPAPSEAGFVLGQDQTALGAAPTCTVAGPVAGAGTYPIVCSGAQNASGGTPAAPDTDYEFIYVPGVLTVARAPQTIVFAAPPGKPVAGGSFVVRAAGGASGNPVVFSIDPRTTQGACSLRADGKTVDFEHAGNCVLEASQAGDHNYLAATASETIVVGRNVPIDRFYWADFESGTIRVESGLGPASTLFRGQAHPSGLAVDLAAGKIYWTNTGAGTIVVGNLNGSGRPRVLFAGESTPLGLAIDPAREKLYWSDYNANWDNKKPGAIRVGNLNGPRSASTLFANQDRPTGVVIDPARGTIYWTDYKASARSSAGAVRVGRLSGVGSPTTLFLDSGGPAGLALSPTLGEIFWSDIRTGSLRMGRVDRPGSAATVLAGDNSPFGVAIDPAQREIFWTDYHKSNRASTGAIKMRLLGASGLAPSSVTSSLVAGESGPTLLAVAGAPAATAPPVISGGRLAGRALACTRGQWAHDVLVASFYRVPQRFSYQWRRDHAAIPGATAVRYTPPVAGSYSCTVTAVNQAGATTQASAPVIVGPAPVRHGVKRR